MRSGWISKLLPLLLFLLVAAPPRGLAAEAPPALTGPVVVDGYPEYHVNGKPFFPYAAAFYYHRIPADLWAPTLVKLKQVGFNTLDLYVIWNWHQPAEDVLDLDGHTNPRRNLKGLLELASSLELKVILRPGPYIFNEWRNGGYPDWLMRKQGFHITPEAVAEGWFPIPSSLQYLRSEEAAQLWLENSIHWEYTGKWFAELWKVAGPYSASRGGPVIAVQVDDDLAVGYYNYNGPTFWRYVLRNQQLFDHAGVDVPLFTNAAFMRVTASASQPPEANPLWIIGQWYLRTGAERLEEGEVAGLQFAAEILKTQPHFPPMMIEFNTNQYAGPEESHAQVIAPPRDMLLAARVLYQNGLRGMTIYPVQDTLYPAGWEFPPANYHYTWESALDIALGERAERLQALQRDGALIKGLGSLLAATHEQADLGLVYTLSAYPQEQLDRQEMKEFARRLVTLQQLAYHARVNTRYVDVLYESINHLTRHRLLVLPVAPFRQSTPEGSVGEPIPMLEQVQQKLVEYVRQGGTLVVLPQLPEGQLLKALFPVSGSPAAGAEDESVQMRMRHGRTIRALGERTHFGIGKNEKVEPLAYEEGNEKPVAYRHWFGQGEVIVLGFDFFSWVPHAPVLTVGAWSPAAEFSAGEKRQALQLIDWLLEQAGVRRSAVPVVEGADPLDEYLYTTLMVSNKADADAYGFVAATNWRDRARRSDIRVADPRRGDPLVLPDVHVPGRDSILLPVRIPLNRLVKRNNRGGGFAPGEDLMYATAELTSARFANRILTLEFYAPGPAEIVLRLNNPPLGNTLSGDETLLTTYSRESRLARIEVPPGTAPDYRRTVRIPYFPFQPVFGLRAAPTVVAGERLPVRVRLGNPGGQPLAGRLVLETPASWPAVPGQDIRVGPGAQPLPGLGGPGQVFEFEVSIPAETVPESEWLLRACLEGTSNACSEPHQLRVVEPVRWRVWPREGFRIRDDVSLPTWPPLWAITVPGQADFNLYLENPLSEAVEAKLAIEGEALWFELEKETVELQPGQETVIGLLAWPRPRSGADQTTSGIYSFTIHVQLPRHSLQIPIHLVGIRAGEALAYWYDFDRDGFDDLVLENERLRAIVMPGAGGRVFALVDKATGRNALNTVGGLRDSFSKHPPTYTWKGRDLRRPPWRWTELVLHNRAANVQIVRASGPEVTTELTYEAKDVFPKGVTVRKKVSLAGRSELLLVEYEIVTYGGDPEQSFRSGFSTSVAGELRPAAEFLLPKKGGVVSHPFMPESRLAFSQDELDANWFGISDPGSGDLMAVFWQGAAKMVMEAKRFSALVEVISSPLRSPGTHHLRLGYSLPRTGLKGLRKSYEAFMQLPR